MFKATKAKVIFSAYLTRVLPDSSQTNLQASQYYPSIQFKIDFDSACIGSMMLNATTDISVRETIDKININGYTAQGNTSGL